MREPTMIKMFCAVPRRPDVSEQAFHDHWRHPHGSMALEIEAARHYTQTHRAESDLLNETQRRYDGIVEVWFDSEADAVGLPANPDYQLYLAPDEPNFIAVDGMHYVFTDEEIVDAGPEAGRNSAQDQLWRWDERPNSIKLIQLVEADGDIPWAHADDRALGRAIGALRHVRCRPRQALHPDGAAFVGIRELWWPTLTAFEAGVARGEAAFRALLDRPARAVCLVGTAERLR